MPSKITLQSKEKDNISVDIIVAKKSKTLRTMLDVLGIESGDEEEIHETLPLASIRTPILRKIIDWCTKNKDKPDIIPSEMNKDVSKPIRKKIRELDAFEKEYVKVSNSIVFEIILAANYLHIPGLLDLLGMHIASKITDRTTEEIVEEFNIPGDIPEDKAEVKVSK